MGLTPAFFGRIDEVHRAENVAVIGHGNGRHAQFFHALDKLFHVAGAVEHGVIGMEMQVNELRHVSSVMILRWRHSNGKSQAGFRRIIHSVEKRGRELPARPGECYGAELPLRRL